MQDLFTVRIALGSDAMQDQDDLSRALRAVADKLDAGRDGGRIMDANGNTVGEFGFEGDR